MKTNIILLLSLFYFGAYNHSSAQDFCGCENLEITLCYLNDYIFCGTKEPAAVGACGYALNGRHMRNYLLPKLQNSNNFGESGISKCPMVLQSLGKDLTVELIEEKECDIIFTGNFALDTINQIVNTSVTSISDFILAEILEWSTKCESNLVITSQAEAKPWGYVINDTNQNPNFSNGSDLGEFVFDGPFGNVEIFEQGGSYQGVIVEGPNTGYSILANDANNKPTLVIDNHTNDIILGDIGIFCGGNVGEVSFGENIIAPNDRLVANIFALGCLIAGANEYTVEEYLCEDEILITPLGEEITEAGVYVDSLLNQYDCDSIVTRIVNVVPHLESDVDYFGCEGDGYQLIVGNRIYNETYPSGQEILTSFHGCDSIVNIEFEFKENQESDYSEEICYNDLIGINIGGKNFNALNPQGIAILAAANGCDSIVNVDLQVLRENSKYEEYFFCKGEAINVYNQEYLSPKSDSIIFTAFNGCDSIIRYSVQEYPEISNFGFSSLELNLTTDYFMKLELNENQTIQWYPENLVSCSDCSEFYIYPDLDYETLSYTITDENECSETFELKLNYDCPVYIPNVFYPTSENVKNQTFNVFTACSNLIEDFELTVYDRWGNTVYLSDDINGRWDGKFRGVSLPKGVYIYTLNYSTVSGRKQITGDVTKL